MKKTYTKPEIEVLVFSNQPITTTSQFDPQGIIDIEGDKWDWK